MIKEFIERKKIRYHSSYYLGSKQIYFLTICTSDKEAYFLDDHIVNIIKETLKYHSVKSEIKIYCYCIMPDHLLLLLSLDEGYQKDLSVWVESFKCHTSFKSKPYIYTKSLWQRNFHDHILREDESAKNVASYILDNPVRKKFARHWTDWPHTYVHPELIF